MKQISLLTIICLIAIGGWAQDETLSLINDSNQNVVHYHPFVEAGKRWHIDGFNMKPSHTAIDYYFDPDAETIDGHTYLKMYELRDNQTTLVGLFREENKRVYLYKKDAGREVLTYDFSLEEGDRFSPEYGHLYNCEVKNVSYLEINGERLKVITFEANDSHTDADVRVQRQWVEGIGDDDVSGDPSPLSGLYSGNYVNSWGYFMAYVVGSSYLPFTFGLPYAGWRGTNLVRIRKLDSQQLTNEQDSLSYEFIPDPARDCYALHVSGRMWMQCGSNNYVYCISDQWSEIGVERIRIVKEEVEPIEDCISPYEVDFSFPFFDGRRSYVIDDFGEHLVSFRKDPTTTYRPFIEEGKVWKTGWFNNNDTAIGLEYHYFDGDTIVGGQPCKKMMCRYEYAPQTQWPGHEARTEYTGAVYEKDKFVYLAYPNSEQWLLIYDFASPEDATIDFYDTENKVTTTGRVSSKQMRQENIFHGTLTKIERLWGSDNVGYGLWREGVGHNCLQNVDNLEKTSIWQKLMSCTVGDEVLYYDTTLTEDSTSFDGDHNVKKQQLDFTHIVKPRPKAPGREGKWMMEDGRSNENDEETVTGEYSVKELFVNFKTLAGAYTVTLTDVNDKEVYRKVIETSNTVGLATDLTHYGHGTYNLTIENDEEQYIATLYIDDKTGIENVNVNENEKLLNHNYYDLSGRPVSVSSVLPRGVYIKDGRKVVIR